MYTESKISIKSSASLLHNNLDVLVSADGRTQYAVVHKSNVWIFDAEEIQSNQAAYRRVVCKGEGSQASSVIMQVSKYFVFTKGQSICSCFSILQAVRIFWYKSIVRDP